MISNDITNSQIIENLNNRNTAYHSNKHCQKRVNIPNEDKLIIKYPRKDLFYDNNKPSVKKEESVLFNETMNTFDRVKICELFGTFLSCKFSHKYNKNNIINSLYCDVHLSILTNVSDQESEKKIKKFSKIVSKITRK